MAQAHAQRIANYLASHPGATVKEARGHGATPEHGVYVRPGGQVREVFRTGDVGRALDQITRKSPDARVEITVLKADGESRQLLSNPGRQTGAKASYVRDKLKGKRFAAGIVDAMGGKRYKNDRRFSGVTRVQIRIL